ncbi:MAG: hypothetical protein ABI333_01255 [bacterium]
MVEHPRGVLIGAATLLGLIIVLRNWRWTKANLLVGDVELPFIVWALIFMLIGYLTGKWIEWGIQQRRIRRGTYKPRTSPDELADATATLEGRLERTEEGEGDPATIIDRSGGGRPAAHSAELPVERVDYWEDAKDQPPERRPAPDGSFSPAAARAAAEPPRGSRARDEGRGYRDYGDYNDAGRHTDTGRYGDYADSGGRYDDYQDSGARYDDYQDGGARRGGRRR